jgi:hypothetical protein
MNQIKIHSQYKNIRMSLDDLIGYGRYERGKSSYSLLLKINLSRENNQDRKRNSGSRETSWLTKFLTQRIR